MASLWQPNLSMLLMPRSSLIGGASSHISHRLARRNVFRFSPLLLKNYFPDIKACHSPNSIVQSFQQSSSAAGSTEAASPSSWQSSSRRRSAPFTPPTTPEETAERLQKFRALVQDILKTAAATGPSGALRFFQGVEAFLYVGREWVQRNAKASRVVAGGSSPFGTSAPLTNLFGVVPAPVLLRLLFERLGATYIKLGQFIASTPTLFPAEYVEAFQACLDAIPSIPFEVVRGVIQEDLGRPIEDVFHSIDPQPLASASVAQVHAAKLKGSQRDVVVKVVKPGVDDILKADLNFLYVAARLLEFLNPEVARSTSLVGIVADIRQSMMEETNLLKEATNIETFRAYLEGAGLSGSAAAPEVFRFASSKRVLTMERFFGVPLVDLDAIRTVTKDPEATLITALNVWFGSVLACETFHADLHAGNLLVLNDGRVGFIDFGIVGKISPPTWAALQSFLQSVGSAGQYQAMAAALAQMGATDKEVDLDSFAGDLEVLFSRLDDIQPDVLVAAAQGPEGTATIAARVTVDDRQINALVLEIIRVSERYGLRFPREFGLFLKQLLYFDRYTRLLAPNLKVLEDDRVVLQGQGSRRQGRGYGSSYPGRTSDSRT